MKYKCVFSGRPLTSIRVSGSLMLNTDDKGLLIVDDPSIAMIVKRSTLEIVTETIPEPEPIPEPVLEPPIEEPEDEELEEELEEEPEPVKVKVRKTRGK